MLALAPLLAGASDS